MTFEFIQDPQDFLERDSSRLARTILSCPYCGREHKVSYQEIMAYPGAIQEVPRLCNLAAGNRKGLIGVVYDRAIEPWIEAEFLARFSKAGLFVVPIPLGETGTWLDSSREIGDLAASHLPERVDLLIGAGSGVICDLTKWIATRAHMPFLLCGSAPSMNGYTSITAVISEHDIKLTKMVDVPYAVIMDPRIMAQAPAAMIRAGVGDLAARTICNADWRLSNFLHGTYFCPLPFQMTAASEARYLAQASGIARAEVDSISQLSEAIAISGLSMSILDGETSPSSGGEHVISHYWDFMSHIDKSPRNLHGAQVGVATMIMLAGFEILRELDPSHFDPDRLERNRLSLETIQAMNTHRFGSAATPLNETSSQKFLPLEKFRAYIHKVVDQWEELLAAIAPYTASLDFVRNQLKTAGVPLSLSSLQRTRQQAVDALLFGGRYRPRFTLLDLAWDLGLFPDLADDILVRSGVLEG